MSEVKIYFSFIKTCINVCSNEILILSLNIFSENQEFASFFITQHKCRLSVDYDSMSTHCRKVELDSRKPCTLISI